MSFTAFLRQAVLAGAIVLTIDGCSKSPTRPDVSAIKPQVLLRVLAGVADGWTTAPLKGLVGTIVDEEDRGHIVHGYYIAVLPGDEETIAAFDTVTRYIAPSRIARVSNRESRAVWYPGHRVIVHDDGPYGRSIQAVSTDGRRRAILVTAAAGTAVSCPAFSGDGRVFAYLEYNPNTGNVIRAFRNDSLILQYTDWGQDMGHPTLSADGTLMIVQFSGEHSLGLIHLDRAPGAQYLDLLPIRDAHDPAFDSSSNDRFVYSVGCRTFRSSLSSLEAPVEISFPLDGHIVCTGYPSFSSTGRHLLIGGWTGGEWFIRWFILPGDAAGSVDPPSLFLPAFNYPRWQ